MDDAVASELIERGHNSLVESAMRLGRLSLDGEVEEEDGLKLISTGVPAYQLNSANVTRVPDDPLQVLASARRFFAGKNAEWRLWAWGEAAEAIAAVAEGAGFVQGPLEPAMVMSPLPERVPALPPGVTIEAVDSRESLAVFHETFAGIFVIPLINVARVFNSGLLDLPEAIVLLARVEGDPAGMVLGFEIDGVVFVMTVGTLPHFRRRGVGTALVWSAIASRRETCDAAFILPASGYAVYEDMGFRHAIDYRVWSL